MQGFDVALDVEQRRSQLVRDVADKTALRCIELHLTGEILNGDGDALQAFSTGIAHGLHHDAQGPGWFAHTAPKVFTVGAAEQEGIQSAVDFDREQFR